MRSFREYIVVAEGTWTGTRVMPGDPGYVGPGRPKKDLGAPRHGVVRHLAGAGFQHRGGVIENRREVHQFYGKNRHEHVHDALARAGFQHTGTSRQEKWGGHETITGRRAPIQYHREHTYSHPSGHVAKVSTLRTPTRRSKGNEYSHGVEITMKRQT